jgi:hypothetical protein
VLSPAPTTLALPHPRLSYVQIGRPSELYIRNIIPNSGPGLSGRGYAGFQAVVNFAFTEFSEVRSTSSRNVCRNALETVVL